jgi:cobalamin synthase
LNRTQTTTYLAVVTAVGVGLTLERALNGDTGDTIGMLLSTALVIVLPLVFGKPRLAPRAAAAARYSEGDDAR